MGKLVKRCQTGSVLDTPWSNYMEELKTTDPDKYN
jgi:hypothetical protein